jgi:hypothetical protein
MAASLMEVSMKCLLQRDLNRLSSLDYHWTNDSKKYHNLSDAQASIVNYWTLAHLRIDDCLKDEEYLLLVQLLKRILEIMVQGAYGGGKWLNATDKTARTIIETIESAHVARFERKLKHAKANPQLLLEAKAQIREKKAIAKRPE